MSHVGTSIPSCLKIILDCLARLLIFKSQHHKFSGFLSQVGIVSTLSLASNWGSWRGLPMVKLLSSGIVLNRLWHGLFSEKGFLDPLCRPLFPSPLPLRCCPNLLDLHLLDIVDVENCLPIDENKNILTYYLPPEIHMQILAQSSSYLLECLVQKDPCVLWHWTIP